VVAHPWADAETYSVLCYLPLCHVAERSFSTLMHLVTGCTVSFAESVDTVVDNLREIAPLGFLGVPRIWEKMQQSVLYRVKDARRCRAACSRPACGSARRSPSVASNGGKLPSIGDRLEIRRCGSSASQPAVHFLGLNRVAPASAAARRCRRTVLTFFWILGVPVYQIYGMTESAGVTHTQQPGFTTLGAPAR
jgi:long-chain acyl-CoA synthetase